MKTSILSVLPLAAAILVSACNSGSSENDDRDSASVAGDTIIQNGSSSTPAHETLQGADTAAKSFVTQAAIGGLMEVEAGKLAKSKALNADVKAFGEKMIADHSKANEELKALAAKKGLSIPSSLPEAEGSHLNAMKNLSGAAFDKHYLEMMVNDHGKTISLFEQATMSGDADIKSWAEKTLPVLKMHNELANKLYSSKK